MKIKDISKHDRPREKLERYGLAKLADQELLAVILGSGVKGTNVIQLSQKILNLVNKTPSDKLTLENLTEIRGLGKAKAMQVLSTLELGKRLTTRTGQEIFSNNDVWKLCGDFRDSHKEHFVAFYLDAQHRLIERHIISVGTLSESLVHPREVFEPAISLHAASIIIAHNHPSGLLKPSDADRELTRKLIDSGALLGVAVEDHVIISSKEFLSFRKESLL